MWTKNTVVNLKASELSKRFDEHRKYTSSQHKSDVMICVAGTTSDEELSTNSEKCSYVFSGLFQKSVSYIS